MIYDTIGKTYEIAARLELRPEDADGELWKLSVPKLIDNAIIVSGVPRKKRYWLCKMFEKGIYLTAGRRIKWQLCSRSNQKI